LNSGFSGAIVDSVDADDGKVDGQCVNCFFGVSDPNGILAITLSNTSGGIEMDHLQYGIRGAQTGVPEPATLTMFGAGLCALALVRFRSRQR
jgi:PEP-CTERM motif